MKRNSTAAADPSTGSLRDHVADLGDTISGFVSENTGAARERISDLYDGARNGLASGMNSTRVLVREHPFESIFIGVGVGVIIGAISSLFFRGRR